jgi:hypothetical protein
MSKLVTLKVTEELHDKIKIYAAQNKVAIYEVVASGFEKLTKDNNTNVCM